MQSNNTQIPRVTQARRPYSRNGISTYAHKDPVRGWVPLAMEYYPERPRVHQVAAYVVVGTDRVYTPEQVRDMLAAGTLVPSTQTDYWHMLRTERANSN